MRYKQQPNGLKALSLLDELLEVHKGLPLEPMLQELKAMMIIDITHFANQFGRFHSRYGKRVGEVKGTITEA